MVYADPGAHGLRATAISRLRAEISSHLNTYTELSVSLRHPSVRFSPCPEADIEVLPMDYPVGRPARFAYLDAESGFRVVEARSAEKGPFRTLASGRLERGRPLAIDFFDDGKPVYRVTLENWAAQASVQTSPTAGWGVPENAIEFSLGAAATVHVYITLAATSVGRGYDSVTHGAGVYLNRMSVSALDP